MDSNSIAILDFFQTESNVRLFKKQFLEKLIDSSSSDADCCENDGGNLLCKNNVEKK
jgi:hypothetical protein